jgi:glycosyltransferase involved in cell wall biosynthesis
MQELLDNREMAMDLGRGALQTANERFNIERFKKEWLDTFSIVTKVRRER